MKKDVINSINNYIQKNNGKIYAPIPHPIFRGLECKHSDRSEIIKKKIQESKDLRTGLDIGSHWGEMCYTLEDAGIEVTAIEKSRKIYQVLTELKKDLERNFNTIHGNVFSLKEIKYDVIVALNIFHHFLKQKDTYDEWLKLLKRLDCKVMFFQAHNPKEKQMIGAYKNFNSEEFVDVILKNSCLNTSELILDGDRPLFMLTI